MTIERDERPRPARPVTVFTGEEEGVEQPHTFHFCPLGTLVYTRSRIPECCILELKVQIPNDDSGEAPIDCCGIVANCCPTDDGAMFRVWIKFLDLPERSRTRIQCVAKSSEFLCPFCENF